MTFGYRASIDGQEHVFTIQQRPTKAVAWKIYPGAFLLCGYLARSLDDLQVRGSVVLELGAGVCGLPSLLLARAGVDAIATVREEVSLEKRNL